MNAPFRRVLAAEAVSNFGSMLSRLAIPWIAALALDATPLDMGLLVVADVAAGALGSLFLGVAVDRCGKRATMIFADVARAALIAGVALAAYTGRLPFWGLVGAAALGGMLTILFELARSAWMAQRLALHELDRGNAQVAVAGGVSETAAFALGGWLYQGLGASIALALDAVTYLLSALFLRRVPEAAPAQDPKGPASGAARVWHETREGIASLAAAPMLRLLAAVEILVALGGALAETSYMIFVARDLGFDTGSLGMIFAAGGIGSLAGAALAPGVRRAVGRAGAMATGLALTALGAFCIPLAPGATIAGAALLVAHQVVGDGGRVLYDVHDRTLRQTLAPQDQLARVDAAIRALGQAATLVGALVGGALASQWGTRPALVLSAAILACAALVFQASPLARAAGSRT